MSKGRKKKTGGILRRFLGWIPLWLRILVSAAAIIAIVSALGLVTLPRLGIDLKLPFSSHRRISESDFILQQLRPILKLTTVEYSYKTVFPYDFIPEGVDISRAYSRYINGEQLTSGEKEAAKLYRLCVDTGIRVWSSDYPFVVITTRVKGGYDLSESPWMKSGAQKEALVQSNSSLGSVSVLLPAPEITEFIIRDETSAEYPYPDIEVDADQWRKISEYVEERIRRRVIQEGILDKTEENMRRFITKLLEESGWEQVSFRS